MLRDRPLANEKHHASGSRSTNKLCPMGVGLFLFAFPCPPLEGQRKGIRNKTSVNSVSSNERSEWAVEKNIIRNRI